MFCVSTSHSFSNTDSRTVALRSVVFVDLSRHIVKDNESVQALLDKGNEKRFVVRLSGFIFYLIISDYKKRLNNHDCIL